MKNYHGLGLSALLTVIISIYGCNPNMIPLKGKYVNSSFETTVNKPADSVWVKIADLFAVKGLPVKSIDKNKGLIITKKTAFNSAYSFEDKDGNLEEPQAWVVLYRIFLKEKQWLPKEIYSKWSIQVTEIAKGTTLIKVDPTIFCTYFQGMFVKVVVSGQTTGVLEELIKRSFANDNKVVGNGP